MSANANMGRRCVVVGQGTLPQACAEILLGQGYAVESVITGDARFSAWAAARGIAVASGPEALQALVDQGIDLLFSVVNPHILPDALLAGVRRHAINYHDAPLPRYAGTCATAWALMAGETHHGVSWHLMNGRVDSGDILAQEEVDIAPDDTSLSLNIKCYDAALRSFAVLAKQLLKGEPVRRQQDPARRSFFAKSKRPHAACTLDWRRPAAELSALVRALQFGPYPNGLGLPKLWLGDGFILVGSLTLADTRSGCAAGTVLAVDEHGISVAAADGDMLLSRLSALDGTPLDVADLAARHSLGPEVRLPLMTQAMSKSFDEICRGTARHEAYWLEQLRRTKPFQFVRSVSRPMATQGFDTLAPEGWSALDLAVAFAAYLARLEDVPAIDLGLQHPGSLAAPAGLLARTVPVRLAFPGTVSVANAMEQGREAFAQACAHGSHTCDLALRHPDLGRERAGQHWPVVVRIAPRAHTSIQAEPCILLLEIAPDGRQLRFEYDTSAFGDEQAKNFAVRFLAFAERLRATPALTLRETSLLDALEAQRILQHWNDTATEYSRDETVDSLFRAKAGLQPDRIALSWTGGAMSYRELDLRTDKLAQRLRLAGAVPEARVALCIERSFLTVVAMLAVLKSGAAYVPLDPSYPVERLAYMLDDSAPVLLLTETRLRDTLPLRGIEILCLDEIDMFSGDALAADIAHHQAAPQNLACVIYTSGSTGQPKGVCITHRGINNFIFGTHHLALRPDDVMAQAANSSFDAITFEVWGALLHGCRLHVLDYEAVTSPHRLATEIRRVQISVMLVTTALFNHISAQAPAAFSGMRALLFGGDAADPCAVSAVLEHSAPGIMLNCYGPTETTTYSISHRVAGEDCLRAGFPIGRPIANTRIYVLDKNYLPVPPGTTGELYTGGDGLARGYANLPGMSAERFLPDPFSAIPGERMYKSGDLVRYLEDGVVEYVGRADRQVKIRGFRIEPGEIDVTLASLPAVAEGVTLVHGGGAADKRLVAYVSLRPGAAQSAGELKDALHARLPSYMVPQQIVLLDRMPLTANGKVDRAALPAPDPGAGGAGYCPPTGELERQLAHIWARTLGLPRAGVHDSFFDMGGHSLMGAALMLTIRREMHVDLPLKTLFEAPTVAAMALRIDAAKAASAPAASVPWSLEQNWSSAGRNLSRLAPLPDPTRSIFLMPGGGGSAEVFHGVARSLVEQGARVYVLHHDGVDNESTPAAGIVEMARCYAEQILPFCSAGPVAFAGYCIGGVIAHEMGKLLSNYGVTPRGMLFVDTPLPKPNVNAPFDAGHARSEFFKAICDVHAVQETSIEAADFKGLDLDACIALTISAMGEQAMAEARLWESIFQRRYDAEIAHLTAIHAYWAAGGVDRFADELGQVPWHLAMLNTSESHASCWPGKAGPVSARVDVVEGRHVTVLQEHAAAVSRLLLDCFEPAAQKAALVDMDGQ